MEIKTKNTNREKRARLGIKHEVF